MSLKFIHGSCKLTFYQLGRVNDYKGKWHLTFWSGTFKWTGHSPILELHIGETIFSEKIK